MSLATFTVEEARAVLLKNIENGDLWSLSDRIILGKQVTDMLDSSKQGTKSVLKACSIVNNICEEKALYLFEKSYTAWFQAIYSNVHGDVAATRDLSIFTLTTLIKECHENMIESKKLVSLWVPKLESTLVKAILSGKKSDTKVR